MRVLLDTHILLWSAFDSPKLPDAVKIMIQEETNEIICSTASIWEVAIKHSANPERLKFSGLELARYSRAAGYEILPITDSHVAALETLRRKENAPRHKDPFDRILIAQAKAERLVFITHDHLLEGYDEPFIYKI